MARLIGPDSGDRLTVRPGGSGYARSASVVVYAASTGSTKADILTEAGAAISGSTLTTDDFGLIPLFQFPDGVDTVYVEVAGGPRTAVYARYDDRVDGVAARVAALEAGTQAIDPDLTAIAALDSSTAGALVTDGSGWIRKTYAQLKTALALVKGDVGLGNVDNTADTAKPISTATQTALDLKLSTAAASGAYAPLDWMQVEDASGEWWIYPVATFLRDPARTYFGAIGGDPDETGTADVLACYFDHGTQQTKRVVVGQSVVDDHCVPALAVREGRRSVIVWNNHSADDFMHIRVGAKGGGIDTWEPDVPHQFSSAIIVSYNQLFYSPAESTPDDDVFWLLFRYLAGGTPNTYTWRIVKITVNQETGDATWGTSVQLVTFTNGDQGYLKAVPCVLDDGSNGLRVGVSVNPGSNGGTDHSIHYLEVNLDTGAVTSPGTALAGNIRTNTGLPATRAAGATTDLQLVRSVESGSSARLLDVRPGPLGVAVASATWVDTAPRTATYHHDAWNGATWTTTDLGDPGSIIGNTEEGKYIGGLAYEDPAKRDVILRCRESAGTWYLERLTRLAAGYDVEVLRTSTDDKLARPFSPVNGGPVVVCSAFSHYGSTYTDYAGKVVAA